MMMPEEIRDGLRDKLWNTADGLGWASLNDSERSRYYEKWTKDPSIGGQLAHFMDPRKVRVYIKDSLIKPYERARLLASEAQIWHALEMAAPTEAAETFIKPHGCRWGKSRDWKLILMAVFERGKSRHQGRPFGAVLLETGKTPGEATRNLVRDAATRLNIEKLVWLD
jgi:hypothetical protein